MVTSRGVTVWSMSTLAPLTSWMCFTVQPLRPIRRATKRGSQVRRATHSAPATEGGGPDESLPDEDGGGKSSHVGGLLGLVFWSFFWLSYFLSLFSPAGDLDTSSSTILYADSTEFFFPEIYIILFSSAFMESWSIQILVEDFSIISRILIPPFPMTQPTTEGEIVDTSSVLESLCVVETTVRSSLLFTLEEAWGAWVEYFEEPDNLALLSDWDGPLALAVTSAAAALSAETVGFNLRMAFLAFLRRAALPGTPLRE
mmetsp:Transcript_1086/g.1993  ORF Transcript_1086/g.1993 Transcript_1086/m.1993 type:complete len:257 (+) Transcript_1086:1022-1792(+)